MSKTNKTDEPVDLTTNVQEQSDRVLQMLANNSIRMEWFKEEVSKQLKPQKAALVIEQADEMMASHEHIGGFILAMRAIIVTLITQRDQAIAAAIASANRHAQGELSQRIQHTLDCNAHDAQVIIDVLTGDLPLSGFDAQDLFEVLGRIYNYATESA